MSWYFGEWLCPVHHAVSQIGKNMQTESMKELNEALVLALHHSDGNAEAFAFHLTAPLAAWMAQGMLDEDIAMSAIRLLHQLHHFVKF